MQQFSLVYNNLFVFLEAVDELRTTYDCGRLMQGCSTVARPQIKQGSILEWSIIIRFMVSPSSGFLPVNARV